LAQHTKIMYLGTGLAFTRTRHEVCLHEQWKPWGPFLTSPLGANFDPRGKVIPWGWYSLFAPPFFYINSRECSPLVVNEGVNISLRGQFSHLGARSEVKNGPLCRATSCDQNTWKQSYLCVACRSTW
jgi:hypothetical protein